jgi:hypothetical protein
MRGVPNMSEFGIVNWEGRGHVNFTPIAPMKGYWKVCQRLKNELDPGGILSPGKSASGRRRPSSRRSASPAVLSRRHADQASEPVAEVRLAREPDL